MVKAMVKEPPMADRFTPVGPDTDDSATDTKRPALSRRLFWFILISLGSVLATASIAYLLRALILID